MIDDAFAKLIAWIDRLQINSPPPRDIVAFNFGLFETDAGYRMHLVGSRIFDPEDSDWACSEDYSPADRYFDHEFSVELSWTTAFEQAVSLLRKYIESIHFERSFLSAAKAITIGFDDGDLERII